jgi:hypothetical protein
LSRSWCWFNGVVELSGGGGFGCGGDCRGDGGVGGRGCWVVMLVVVFVVVVVVMVVVVAVVFVLVLVVVLVVLLVFG